MFPVAVLSLSGVAPVAAAILQEQGFEEGLSAPTWTTGGTQDGRAVVTGVNGPATGSSHLVLDDAVTDAAFSAAEATLKLDLSNKKGVVLTFKAKSIGNEPHDPPAGNFTTTRNYDGVAISTDGGGTWRSVQSLANVDTTWQTFIVPLDAAVTSLGGIFCPNFLIRFSAFDNSQAPLDGIAIDDVSVTGSDDQRVVLEMPGAVTEGSGPHTGYAMLAYPATAATMVSFTTHPAGQLTIPAVTIPKGEIYASFTFSSTDDALVNLTRTITVTPSAAGATGSASSVKVNDNETPPVATLNLPASVTEGMSASNNATVNLSFAAAAPIVFTLSASPSGEVSIPATVTVAAGQTSASFTVAAVNDTLLDGTIATTITATAASLAPASGQLSVMDNEIPSLAWTLPGNITEGTTGTGTVTLSSPLGANLEVFLTSSASGTLSMPVKVVIPAGQTSANVPLTAVDDKLVNLSRTVTLTAAGAGVSSANKTLVVDDNEPAPVLGVTLPAQLTEGGSPGTGTVTISPAAAVNVTVSLTSLPASELAHSSTVTINAGTTSATFSVSAANDTKIDGSVPATLTATATGMAPATAQCVALDNETRTLSFTLPATIQEGTTASATVKIPGTLTTPLTVELTSSLTDSLIVPSAVVIAAGQTQAAFSITAPGNELKDGTRIVTLTATAATFTTGSAEIPVKDDDVAGYKFSTIPDLVAAESPLTVTISATDVEGTTIPGVVNSLALAMVAADGSSRELSPSNVVLGGSTGWTGALTLPAMATAASPLRLRATDPSGLAGDSSPFDLIRTLALKTSDLVWDQQRGKIYASVPSTASGPYANQVVAIDPLTLQVTASVTTYQDPGQIVMTSGGEYLYVALNANGTIAKINPATMSVLSTFAVGTDPNYGTLYASDICAVAGQPNLVVVSQMRKNVSPSHNGVAVYDNGVRRATKTQDHTGSDVIEPSADPTIFFGYNTNTTEFGFRRLKLSASGMTQLEVKEDLFDGFGVNMRSSGDRVYSTNGVGVDGNLMKKAGTFATSGVVCPDAGSGRVFYMEQSSSYSTSYNQVSGFDPATFTLVKRLTMPTYTSPGTLIRWGANGMAFRTADLIGAFSSSALVPSGAPADLVASVQANPNPAAVGSPLTYTVTVTNQGPNPATATSVNVSLSSGQSITSATSSTGSPVVNGLACALQVPAVAAGQSVTVTVVANPLSAGSLTCTASAASTAMDPNQANNSAFKLASVGFNSAGNSVNFLRLAANNLLADPTRGLLWATTPETVEAPLGRSVVSINPTTGLVSDPIPLNAIPAPNAMALSGNGRYLYVGLADITEIARLDLGVSPPSITRVPLGANAWGGAGYARDIEVLDGDGTSILVTTSGDYSALVIDGTTRRATRTGIYTVGRVEKGASPGVYIGYNDYTSGFDLSLLSLSAAGVTVTQDVGDVISGYYTDLRSSGNLLLSSSGKIVDMKTLSLKADVGTQGAPCIDAAYQRAYIVNGASLFMFDTNNGSAAGTIALPTTATESNWASCCVRWGVDGLAFIGNDGRVYVLRSAMTQPAAMDSDSDGIPNAWAASYFGSPNVGPGDSDGDGIPDRIEYFFGTSPKVCNPRQMALAPSPPQDGKTVTHLYFNRRSGISRTLYDYEVSENLSTWVVPTSTVVESVLSTETIDGIQVECVDAAITVPWTGKGFVRIKWK